jgi:hypothetical protein
MKNKKWFYILILGLCAVSFAFISGCGENPQASGTSAARLYYGTTNAGYPITCSMGDGTFSASTDSGVYFSGVFHRLGSGVISGEITRPGNSGLTGEVFNAVEVPNVLLIGYAAGIGGCICPARTTAARTGKFNAIAIPGVGWSSNPAAFVTAEIIGSSPNITLDATFYDINGDYMSDMSSSDCTFSRGKYSNGNNIEFFISPAGLIEGCDTTGQSAFIGASFEAVDTFEAASKTYKGIAIAVDLSTGDINALNLILLKPASSSSDNNLLHMFLMDLNTGAPVDPTAPSATIEVGGQDANTGIIPSILDYNSTTYTHQLLAFPVNGKYVLFGLSTDESVGVSTNIIAVQK